MNLRTMLALTFVVTTMAFSAEPEITSKEPKAVALVEKGLAYIKEVGKEKAIEAFNNKDGKFVEGEFYLFGYTLKGVCIVMGVNPKMIGQDLYEMVDADGKMIIQDFIKIATTDGKGWSHYKWSNPTTKKIQDKSSYVVYVKDADMILGCGFYK
jgi:signal transduction histidine kinase